MAAAESCCPSEGAILRLGYRWLNRSCVCGQSVLLERCTCSDLTVEQPYEGYDASGRVGECTKILPE